MDFQLTRRFGLALLALTIALMAAMVSCNLEKDKEECAEQLAGLATCLPYVGGTSKTPTPDCCNGLKQVLRDNKKCLCVIIKDRNDPDLGLKINVTLALGLPTVCQASANVSQCPALLHLAPNSPDAQVFYQFGKNSNQNGTTPAPNVTVGGNIPSSGNNSKEGPSAQKTSSGSRTKTSRKGLFGLHILSFGLSLLYLSCLHMV